MVWYGRHRSQSAKEDIAHPYPAITRRELIQTLVISDAAVGGSVCCRADLTPRPRPHRHARARGARATAARSDTVSIGLDSSQYE
jgi:hypothetical protein